MPHPSPWSGALLEKLVVAQEVKLPTFYEPRPFIIVFTRDRHRSLSVGCHIGYKQYGAVMTTAAFKGDQIYGSATNSWNSGFWNVKFRVEGNASWMAFAYSARNNEAPSRTYFVFPPTCHLFPRFPLLLINRWSAVCYLTVWFPYCILTFECYFNNKYDRETSV